MSRFLQKAQKHKPTITSRLTKALYAKEAIVILSLVYLVLSLIFTFLVYESLPRNGCHSNGVCVDFEFFELTGIVYFFLALFFATLCLKRLFIKATFLETNKYNAKDLSDIDG